ncbi:MAG TPA: hypothetical protein VGS19_24755 [Streptosporangiaceae bacterium]|nr:hypothetical protein [Streptosporangiaceae bacterium]
MSDWTWEYVPDVAQVVGGLTQAQIDEVESLAARIAEAVAVVRGVVGETLTNVA